MKKGTKLGIGLAALLMGGMVLSGCTNSFCSTTDKAHILYAIDFGVCKYFDSEEEARAQTTESVRLWDGSRWRYIVGASEEAKRAMIAE